MTLDGSADEYEQYFVISDDNEARITSFVSCISNSAFNFVPREHFRGFEVTIESPTSGTSTQSFGTIDPTMDYTTCTTFDVS